LETHNADAIAERPLKIGRVNLATPHPKLQDPQERYLLAATRQAFRRNQ